MSSDMSSDRRLAPGVYTAIVTPFRDGKVDEKALEELVERQIQGGVDGIVAVGTTGESPTLSFEEHIHVIELVVRFAAGRTRVIAGTGANATAEAIHLTQAAERIGADGLLQVTPYYNKPTQEGLYQHFLTIARSTSLPIMLYNIPSRCGVEIAVDTIARLAEAAPNIVALKEAGGKSDRVSQVRAALGDRIRIFSGDDTLTLPFLACGAEGVVSVASNLIPGLLKQMVSAFLEGRPNEARQLHERLYPFFKALFIETNPAPIKAALAMKGWIQEELRLPLVPIRPENREKLRQVMQRCGVL